MISKLKQWHNLTSQGILLSVLLIGCASKEPRPIEQLATSKSAIQQAETAGAQELAPAELVSAREKLKQAESAMNAEDYKKAKRMAEEAEADARLAESKAQSAKSQKTADEVQRSIETLREELQRKSP